jgi:hypothetical protein
MMTSIQFYFKFTFASYHVQIYSIDVLLDHPMIERAHAQLKNGSFLECFAQKDHST